MRVALGAQRGRVLGLVVGEGLRLALIGISVGAVLALIATRLLSGFLFGVSAFDPLTFAGIALLRVAARRRIHDCKAHGVGVRYRSRPEALEPAKRRWTCAAQPISIRGRNQESASSGCVARARRLPPSRLSPAAAVIVIRTLNRIRGRCPAPCLSLQSATGVARFAVLPATPP